MKSFNFILKILFFGSLLSGTTLNGIAQEEPLQVSGEILIDNRFRTEDMTWSWNENRLDLQLEKRIPGKAKFFSASRPATFWGAWVGKPRAVFKAAYMVITSPAASISCWRNSES